MNRTDQPPLVGVSHERSMTHQAHILAIAVVVSTSTSAASASFTNYYDRDEWNAAVGSAITTIGVPDIPAGYITNQFLSQGMYVVSNGSLMGIAANSENANRFGVPVGTTIFQAFEADVLFRFTQPINSFALDWDLREWTFVHLLQDNILVQEWMVPPHELGIQNPFYGFTSSIPFNRVGILGTSGQLAYYGAAVHFPQIVPAPACGFALLSVLPISIRKRRR